MPKCKQCPTCTGQVVEFYTPCLGTCVSCGADEKTAGVFRRNKDELWCTDERACLARIGVKI